MKVATSINTACYRSMDHAHRSSRKCRSSRLPTLRVAAIRHALGTGCTTLDPRGTRPQHSPEGSVHGAPKLANSETLEQVATRLGINLTTLWRKRKRDRLAAAGLP